MYLDIKSAKRHNIITDLMKMGSFGTEEFKDIHDIYIEFKIVIMYFHFLFSIPIMLLSITLPSPAFFNQRNVSLAS